MSHIYSYLALGDSYTIGEGVPLFENFPYQTLHLLRQAGHAFYAPEIVAKTGWTTDELAEQLNHTRFLATYDFVSLLIGVNNQYRGRSVEQYSMEFQALLQRAIHHAANNSSRVVVLSIPDWGVTPFAQEDQRTRIATEIDAYNDACKRIALAEKCHFLDITPHQRLHGNQSAFLAADGLHPSGKEYAVWAQRLADLFMSLL